jgi:hypothetical protein
VGVAFNILMQATAMAPYMAEPVLHTCGTVGVKVGVKVGVSREHSGRLIEVLINA